MYGKLCGMKTTVEIPDPLLREIRKLAAREGVTLRALVERGLHRVVADSKERPAFKLRRASFKGNGLHSAQHARPIAMSGSTGERATRSAGKESRTVVPTPGAL